MKKAKATKHLIRFLDHSGDTRVEFSSADAKAKDEAKALFEKLMKGGAIPFAVNRANGQEDMKLTSFDQIENDTVMVPRIVGG